jgi:NADH:ubiquinone oxidoreductase subunit 4 (subunit M)
MLSFLIVSPLFGILVISLMKNAKNSKLMQIVSLFWSLFIFNFSIFLLCFLDLTSFQFQLLEEYP